MFTSNKIVLEKEVADAHAPKVLNLSKDLADAKSILKQSSAESGDCLYNHLVKLIENVLKDRPKNVMDYFESYSRKIREEKEQPEKYYLNKNYTPPHGIEKSKKIIEEFTKIFNLRKNLDVDKDVSQRNMEPNIMEIHSILTEIGVGIHKTDIYNISLALEKFRNDENVESCRFWGKIFGMNKDYWIIEAKFTEKALLELKAEKQKEFDLKENPEGSKIQIDDTVKIFSMSEDTHSQEQQGMGTNKYVYFVSNSSLGETWHELPPVTPKQIIVSRQIKKLLTGDLNSEILSYPVFPGTEKNLLRAIIARISSGTYVAPLNHWIEYETKDAQDKSEEEQEKMKKIEKKKNENDEKHYDKILYKNYQYKPHSPKDLLDLKLWQHIRAYIRKDGRTQNNAETEEIEHARMQAESEYIPPLLTACTDDVLSANTPAWTVKTVFDCNPSNAITFLRSNVWPGAYVFACGRLVDVIYVGWGQKYSSHCYPYVRLPEMLSEYSSMELDVLEINDSCVDEEKEFRLKNKSEQEMIEEEETAEDEDY